MAVKDGSGGSRSKEKIMSRAPARFKSPGFVDLFYAVVVGGSFSFISDFSDWAAIAMKVFLIIVVLEDWFAYYTFVLPNIVERQRYSLYSLSMEFSILMSWYLSIASLNSTGDILKKWQFLWLAVFFFVRFFTGFRAHWKRSTLASREFFSESIYLFEAAVNVVLFYFCFTECVTVTHAFAAFVVVWAIATSIWWFIRHDEFLALTRASTR
jgi:hypothetical protein